MTQNNLQNIKTSKQKNLDKEFNQEFDKKFDKEFNNQEYCGMCGIEMEIKLFMKNDGYCKKCLKYMG